MPGTTGAAVLCTRELIPASVPGKPDVVVWHAIDGPPPAEGDSHLLLCGGGDHIGLPTTPGETRVPSCPDCVAILAGDKPKPPHHHEVVVRMRRYVRGRTRIPPKRTLYGYKLSCDCGWASTINVDAAPKAAARKAAKAHLSTRHDRVGRDADAQIDG